MINYIEVTGGNTQECNLHWPRIPDHPFKILIVSSSGSGKTNVLLYLITQKHLVIRFICIIRIYLSIAINSSSTSMTMLAKDIKNPKTFTDCLENVNDVYKIVEEYNPERKRKVLIVFDDIIADKVIIKSSSNSH